MGDDAVERELARTGWDVSPGESSEMLRALIVNLGGFSSEGGWGGGLLIFSEQMFQ
jgi:hypothetical protein